MRYGPALIISAVIVTPTSGDVVVPTAQERSVTGWGWAEDGDESGSDSAEAHASDFGPFDEAAAITILLTDAVGSGGGEQESSIDGGTMRARGSSFANGEGWSGEGSGCGDGTSHFRVEFDVTEPATFTIEGFIEAYDSGSALGYFDGPDGSIVPFGFASNEYVAVSGRGALEPGPHVLVVQTTGGACGDWVWPGYASGAFDITLVVKPSGVPGDATGDGVVDVNDLLLVLSSWGPCAGCSADLSGDGIVDVADLLVVLANWS